MCAFVLAGCDVDAWRMSYQIEYDTGHDEGRGYAWETPLPIENSELNFYLKRISGEKTIEVMTLLDKEGNELWTKEFWGNNVRGQVVDDELWVCEEIWDGRAGNFLDGLLGMGKLYKANIETGEIEWERELEENEFFITKIGEKCYFYQRAGEEGYAEMYYRSTLEWEKKHLLYQFDYKDCPSGDSKFSIIDFFFGPDSPPRQEEALRFVIGEEYITVKLLDSWESEGGRW